MRKDTYMASQPSDRGSTYSTPRWVKVFGIIVIVLALLVVVVLVTGIGGEHGPGRHLPSGDAGGDTPPASVTEDLIPSSSDPSVHTPPMEHSTQQP
jgi:hypothetical protein